MKLVTLASHRGIAIPLLRRSGSTTFDMSGLHAEGWRVHVRSNAIFFQAPPDEKGVRRLYQRATSDFDLGWEMDDGEDIAACSKWSSPGEETKAVKK
jgi:hypothetical protein